VEITDYALTLFYAQFGKIGFFDEVMSAYRRHEGGIWSQRNSLTQRTALARDLRIIARHMGWRYRRSLKNQAAQSLLKIAKTHLDNGAVSEARKVMTTIFPRAYFLPAFPRQRFLRTFINVYLPFFIPFLRILRRIKWLIIPPKLNGKA